MDFQKTGPKPAVHAHGKADDLAADVGAVHKTGVSVHAPDHRGTRLTADEYGAAMQARINTDYTDLARIARRQRIGRSAPLIRFPCNPCP